MAEKQAPESDGEQPDRAAEDGESGGGESRRNFIKKLPYIAPAIETFLLSETAYAKKKDDDRSQARGRGRGRGRGEVSPSPTEKDSRDKKDPRGKRDVR